MLLKGKKAVVTGGTRGIGRAIVELFARQGARVLFTYRSSKEAASKIETMLADTAQGVQGYQLDVGDYEAVSTWKEDILAEYGCVDILINNAGIIKDKALAMMAPDEWSEVISINLNGVFNMTRSFIISFLKEKKGNIINITSVSGIIGLPRQTNYAASKGGIISFTKSLSREVGAYGVRVNAIAPGFIETDMLKDLKKEYREKMLPGIPLGRFGEPGDVARVALFLAADGSGYITGQTIQVDGGLVMSK